MSAGTLPEEIQPIEDAAGLDAERLDPRVCLPLLGMHLACVSVLWTGISPIAVVTCLVLLFGRAFGLTAGYHRLLSHRSFRTSRPFQLALAGIGASAAQLGPLWWAGHHREHHRYADSERDVHPPGVRGLWWAHMGWLLCRKHQEPRLERVSDLLRYPELRWLERWHLLAPLSLAGLVFGLGVALERWAPALETSGFQLLAWGFVVSTVALYHLTFAVNSLGHTLGWQRFAGRDESRNSLWLALPTLGDGWHNNHHHNPGSARHGFRRSEIDLTYALLVLLSRLGLVWELRHPPAELCGVGPVDPRRRASAKATTPVHEKAKRSPTRP